MIEHPEGTVSRTIVPSSMEIPLATWQHRNLCHLGSQKILSVLKKKFIWKKKVGLLVDEDDAVDAHGRPM